MATIFHDSTEMTVQTFVDHYKAKRLNLSPGFQRQSVWQERDRRNLIDSIVRNYPIPAIFLYKRSVKGKTIYDVVDGKQRLESILMFVGAIPEGCFWAKLSLEDEEEEWWNWSKFAKKKMRNRILDYKLLVIEVNGDQSDIIDLFVRINSTGKALTSSEKRHAKYYDSEYLKTAGRLAAKYENWFKHNKVMTAGQISRMKHVELISELMLAIHLGHLTNKKMALDKAMQADSLTSAQVFNARSRTITALNRVARIFLNLKSTRFTQLSDFYSLVFLIAQFESEGKILTDKRRNVLAQDILALFSNRVDEVRELHKTLKGTKPEQELYRSYLMTVQKMTDDISQRQKRGEILRGLLGNLFESKDTKRLFSMEQRRILWNSVAERKCAECGKRLTWEDFTIDHINPHSKGGRTSLDNAALLCQKHNSSKGNRRRSK